LTVESNNTEQIDFRSNVFASNVHSLVKQKRHAYCSTLIIHELLRHSPCLVCKNYTYSGCFAVYSAYVTMYLKALYRNNAPF